MLAVRHELYWSSCHCLDNVMGSEQTERLSVLLSQGLCERTSLMAVRSTLWHCEPQLDN